MARLRFRFPWGTLLTALGYAAIAAALAYPLLTDFHGHLLLRALLNAAGAALLGGLAWRYSERLTDFVNLHTLPVLRLGASGALALWLATRWTAVYSEFAAGTASWWPHLAASLLFFLAALPTALALVTLLTVVETAFAARRGGSPVGDAVRPLLRHLLIACVAGAAIGYAAIMLPQVPARAALAFAPDMPRASGWIQREQRLFTQVARGWNCEVLVVPPEAPAPSLDRAARSLIARYLAAELHRRSALCVADPTLVARALGSRARSYEPRRVLRLADAIGARALVRAAVRMDPQRPAFSVVLRVARRGAVSGPWSGEEETVWGPIVFSDELPPEAAFSYVMREAAEGLGIELEPAPADAPAQPAEVRRELSLAGLVAQFDDPVANARALQLLAAMHHPAEVAGEHLWERSLVALAMLPGADAQVRTLRARAALHLQRRPHALALLDGLETAEAQALRALADGNLGAAARHAARIEDASGRLTLSLEVEALRGQYGRLAGATARRNAMLDSYPGLAALLYVPFSAGLPQQWEPLVATQLEQLRGEHAAPALAGVVAPISRALAQAAGLGSVADDIERGYAGTWRERAQEWRMQKADDRVAEWDAFDALHAANRTAVLLQARSAVDGPDAAQRLRSLGRSFSGHPGLQAVVAAALATDADAADAPGVNAERARRLARDVVAWEDGETEVERRLRASLEIAPPPPPADEPPRPWRALFAGELEGVDAALDAPRLQRYAQHDFDVLRAAIELQERAGEAARATVLAGEAALRFRGSPARDAFLLARAQSQRDLAAVARLWAERVEDEGDWVHYRALALTHLRARDPAQAQRTMLAFAPLSAGPRAAALLPAASGAELLVAAGETELARPLLLIAAQPGGEVNGGVPQLRARGLLAQLDGDWNAAREIALLMHEQHQDDRALTQAAMVSFLLARPEEGWRTFYEASKRFEHAGPWDAALAGHRIEATRPDEVIAFAKRWKSLSGRAALETRLRGRFLFNMLMVDRPATDWALEAFTAFAEERKDAALAAQARGYAAFKRGRYEEALQHLQPLQESGKADASARPWLALALVQSGRVPEAQALAGPAGSAAAQSFHALLAAAYVNAAAGAVEPALERLWDAFLAMPALPAADPPLVPPGYQLLETCERLHALTGENRYRDLLVELAVRQQRAWPYSWAFAFAARHGAHPDDRERALGIALFLDPESEHLRDFAPEQRQRAAERYSASGGFRRG